jgi:phosphodiesterase/alkaline phosphatase D-like protein
MRAAVSGGRTRRSAAGLLAAAALGAGLIPVDFGPGPCGAGNDCATFPNGVASGDVTQDSAVLWARSAIAGPLQFECSEDPRYARVVARGVVTVADPAVPVRVRVTGLRPGGDYFYRFFHAGGRPAAGRFRTPAVLGTRRGLHFGVTGDWRGDLAPYPALLPAAQLDLEVFVALGDTIYADVASPDVPLPQALTLEEFRAKHAEVYSGRLDLNTLAELRGLVSQLVMIDDHEIVDDFAGGASASGIFGSGGLVNESPLYDRALRAFQEYNPVADEFYGATGDPRTAGKRKLYRFRTYGSDAAFFLLDARSFRDTELPAVLAPRDPRATAAFLARSFDLDPATLQPVARRTLLGRQQLADLQADLLAAQGAGITWKFVFVPEPIQNLGVAFASDRYQGYAAERSELLGFIDQAGISNVVFVTADIHGTLVNNLTYQRTLGGAQVPVASFEISTGALAYDPPLGPSTFESVAEAGLLTPEQVALYRSLPFLGKDFFVQEVFDSQLARSVTTCWGSTAPGWPLAWWAAVTW